MIKNGAMFQGIRISPYEYYEPDFTLKSFEDFQYLMLPLLCWLSAPQFIEGCWSNSEASEFRSGDEVASPFLLLHLSFDPLLMTCTNSRGALKNL